MFRVSSLDNIIFGQGRRLISKLAPPVKPIIIIDDPLIFTQPDMHEGNFGVDTCGNTVLLDFGHIGRLPLSFAKYTIRSRGNDDDSFVGRVAKLLCLPDNSNMESMARISSCLWMAANPKLGVRHACSK